MGMFLAVRRNPQSSCVGSQDHVLPRATCAPLGASLEDGHGRHPPQWAGKLHTPTAHGRPGVAAVLAACRHGTPWAHEDWHRGQQCRHWGAVAVPPPRSQQQLLSHFLTTRGNPAPERPCSLSTFQLCPPPHPVVPCTRMGLPGGAIG